jgi:hypothetical protein
MKRRRYLLIVVIAVAAVVVAVVLDAQLANHQPAITGLEAEPDRVLLAGSCQIVCSASDADGDALSYNWSASEGQITGEGDAVTWTAPDSVGFYDVTVTVTDARGGQARSKKPIEVRTNDAPVITGLIADEIWTLPSGSVLVACNASDHDGDELIYEWTASGGEIAGTGAAADWTAPQPVGIHNITVVASDGYGGSDTRTLSVSVVTGQPPTIEELRITKDRYGHCYLKKSSTGYYVGQGKNYDIECIVADAGIQLSYEWSCDGGEIFETSQDGSMIAWTAPNTSRKVTITVTVSDIADNVASKNLVLSVAGCSTCTFGSCAG